MNANSTLILCDGCGFSASPEHIAARIERLEQATRFRPIHINVLFVALEPMPHLRNLVDSLLSALNHSDFSGSDGAGPTKAVPESSVHLASSGPKPQDELGGTEETTAKLLEFQKRGYYLSFLSECPITVRNSASHERRETDESVMRECISRLAPTLIKRIRFNYKPKHVALVGGSLRPLIEVFEDAGIGPLLLLDRGVP